jgi:hypothetical protein
MNLLLARIRGTIGYTQGVLYIDNMPFCHTLEDEVRATKIQDITAIPAGTYKVIINRSVRFKRMMPLLLNVPGFTGVRIHSGNTAKDTEGCILVGDYAAPGYIKNSRAAYRQLFSKLSAAVKRGETLTITIS